MRSLVRLGVSLLASYGAALVATLFVEDGVRGWYASLIKPNFTPPDWVFAPVWLVLYGFIAVALFVVWERDPRAQEMRGWVPLFFAHLLLNAAWPMFFFGFNAVFIALLDILLLDVAVLLLIFGAYEIDKRAAFLLTPYLLWLFFATVLNACIWFLN